MHKTSFVAKYLRSTRYDGEAQDPKKPCQFTGSTNEIQGFQNPNVTTATRNVMIDGPPAV